MRQILVDEARKRNSAKRGGTMVQVPLDDLGTLAQAQAGNVIALDDALKHLEAIDERQSNIVEL